MEGGECHRLLRWLLCSAPPHPKPWRLLSLPLSLPFFFSLSPYLCLSVSFRDKSSLKLCLPPSGFLLPFLPPQAQLRAGRSG